MFIAHLPAGYLLSKCFNKKAAGKLLSWKAIVSLGLAGSIFPDLDLFYFYFIDERQHQHHSYWTHIPYFWALIYLSALVLSRIINSKKIACIATVLFSGIMLHLILDTIAGGIRWFYPTNSQYVILVEVLPQYRWWVLNFILHWTFVLEITITLAASIVYMYSNKQQRLVPLVIRKTLPSSTSNPLTTVASKDQGCERQHNGS